MYENPQFDFVSFPFSSPLLMSQANHDSKGHILTIVKNKIIQDSKEIGFITKDSLIQNSKGQKIGSLKNDGTLVDEQGNLIGRPGKKCNYLLPL